MSAFVCSDKHFQALAIFAVHRSFGGSRRVDPRYIKGLDGEKEYSEGDLASLYADTLYQENIRSVRARYPDDTLDNLPGPITKPIHIRVDTSPRAWGILKGLSVIQILKSCDCLEYQSCETEDYRDTVGFRLLDSIRRAAIKALPGYDEADWG